jgi:CubicO group peptidase (beta-lactamase class C family)
VGLEVEVEPGQVGFDAPRLRRIDRHFARYVEDGRLRGWLVLVSRRGRIVHLAACGRRDLEADLPVELDTRFRVYSMTKPVTAVAAMQLYEEGAFVLKDPVAAFIPSFAELSVYRDDSASGPPSAPATRPVLLWHLLTHTAGLTYGFHHAHPVDAMYRAAGFELAPPEGRDLAECCDLWAGLPLLFEPGSGWNYSVASDVLGRVVEVISGLSLDRFFAERIFAPLGMGDTGFWVEGEAAGKLAALHAAGPQGRPVRFDELGRRALRRPSCLEGGTGLVSTAADYHRFTQALLRGGELDGARLLGSRTPCLHGPQPPARRGRPRVVRAAAVRRDHLRRGRLRPWVCGPARPGCQQGSVQPRRALLGRLGQHLLLGRPGRAAHRHLHDPADAAHHLPAPLRAAPARLPGPGRLAAQAGQPSRQPGLLQQCAG